MSLRIGVFDSGVGGLTVLRALESAIPNLSWLYLADQAHVPYGGRPLEEIRTFATSISRFLVSNGCNAIVMACNISSATAADSVARELAPLPVWGVIKPAARAASRSQGPYGVLATEGTVRSRAYSLAIGALVPGAAVIEVACPRFVPLVENQQLHGPEAADACREYLAPLITARCSTLVLGCTHYPFLLPALMETWRATGLPQPAVIDPAAETAREVAQLLAPDVESPFPERLLLTTGSLERMRAQAAFFLPDYSGPIAAAEWDHDNCLFRTAAAANT